MLSFRHGSSMSQVKIWSKLEEEDSQELLFNDARDMAKVLIVGVPYSRVLVRVTRGHIKVQITVLSASSWTELWERPIDGAVFCQSSELLKTLFHDLPDEEPHASGHRHEQSGDFQQAAPASSSSSSFDEAMNPPINPPSNTSPVDASQRFTSVEVKERPLKQAEQSTLEIIIFLGFEPGVGMEESELRLARKAENCCALSGTLKLEFSMIKQPPILSMHNERVMDVEVSSTYELPCGSVAREEGPELEVQGQGVDDDVGNQAERNEGDSLKCVRVGILHDLLAASFKGTSSPDASTLWNSEMVGVTSMDVTEKSTSLTSRGNEFGVNVGGVVGHHPGAGFQIMGNFKHARSLAKGKEYTVASKLDAICGTDFILVDRCQRRQRLFDVLGYEAIHKPSLGLLSSLEEGGLNMCVGEPVVSALGKTTTLQFRGRFLLDGERVENHKLCLSRRLAEMIVTEKKRNWYKRLKSKEKMSTEVVLGTQVACFAFMINHAFSLDLYQGAKLVWKLRRARASPIPHIIDRAPQEHVVPQQQVVQQQQAVPLQQQVVPTTSGRTVADGPTAGGAPTVASGPTTGGAPTVASGPTTVGGPTVVGCRAVAGSPPRASSSIADGPTTGGRPTTAGSPTTASSPSRARSSAASGPPDCPTTSDPTVAEAAPQEQVGDYAN